MSREWAPVYVLGREEQARHADKAQGVQPYSFPSCLLPLNMDTSDMEDVAEEIAAALSKRPRCIDKHPEPVTLSSASLSRERVK